MDFLNNFTTGRKYEILRLKAQLAASDYKTLKYVEGLISEEDYAPIKAARQELRDRINALESGEQPQQ